MRAPGVDAKRLLFALFLGLSGLALNAVRFPVLTEETPLFILGNAPVLASFVLFGPGLGVLSGLVSLGAFLVEGDFPVLVYLLEAWVAAALNRRFGSLVFAVVVFWFTAGWPLDLLLYRQMVGLSAAYVTLLFVKQVFNGVLGALLAELLVAAANHRLRGLVRVEEPAPLRQFVFRRLALVVMAPALLLALVYTRSTYERHFDRAAAREMNTAREVEAAVRAFLGEREAGLRRLALAVERAAGGHRDVLIADFHRDHPEFDALGLADAEGGLATASGAHPDVLAVTARSAGFQQARSPFRTSYTSSTVIEPVLDAQGRFGGAVLASLDREALLPLLQASRQHPAQVVSLLDREGRVIASLDPGLPPGTAIDGRVGSVAGWTAARSFSYYPPPDGSVESRLALNLQHSAFQPFGRTGWAALVEVPAQSLHLEMTGSAYQILLFFLATVLLLYFAVSAFAGRVSAPLLTVDGAAEEIAAGRFPSEEPLRALAESPIREVQAVATHFLSMQRALAYHDAVTGLANQTLFMGRLRLAMAQARRRNATVAVLFVDLDRFRAVHDSLGRPGSEELLHSVARRLESVVRAGDTLARLEADEFAVALSAMAHPEDAARAAQKLVEAVRPPFLVGSHEVFLTASIGVSLFPRHGEAAEVLLRHAQAAMYAAKQQGRDGYALYTPEMEAAIDRFTVESRLRGALAKGELTLRYQPQVDTRSGLVEAVEALVRWRQPEGRLMEPAGFIPVAEMSGLIVPIDRWVVRAACEAAAKWQQAGPVRVAVNVSARQVHQRDFVQQVAEALRLAELTPSCLEMEITETVALQNVETTVLTLAALRRLGVRLAVDDFGTGYSSLSYLKRLPVHTVKLDRAFTRDVNADAGDAAIARAVIAMAHSLNLRVVAEGVETADQLRFLCKEGCDAVQGYLYSPPVPLEDVDALLGPLPLLPLRES